MSRQFGASQRNPIANTLAEQDCLVLDGAGDRVECRGADLRDALWSAAVDRGAGDGSAVAL